jgi:putative endopeptidase
MSPETKVRAKEKLNGVANKIGYPDKWRDYAALTIQRDDAEGNALRSNAFENDRQLNKIGQPVDRSEWSQTPPTVNAYYSGLYNNINFPAGILQPPFFSGTADVAANYGSIGVVIGHEMTHGFDDKGRQFDKDGNLHDWWTKEDAEKFDSRVQCLSDQAGDFVAVDDVKQNGKLTLGENTADNGGLHIAYAAYKARTAGQPETKIAGFTPDQRFFLGFAQKWCTNMTPEAARLQALTNPHPMPEFRVNGVVSNMAEYAKAFNCPADAAMVRGEKACRVW